MMTKLATAALVLAGLVPAAGRTTVVLPRDVKTQLEHAVKERSLSDLQRTGDLTRLLAPLTPEQLAPALILCARSRAAFDRFAQRAPRLAVGMSETEVVAVLEGVLMGAGVVIEGHLGRVPTDDCPQGCDCFEDRFGFWDGRQARERARLIFVVDPEEQGPARLDALRTD